MGVKEKEARDETWTGVLNRVKLILNSWKQRGLTLKGKVIVANNLLLTKFIYILNGPGYAAVGIK